MLEQSKQVLGKSTEALRERERLSNLEDQVASLSENLNQARAQNVTVKNL